MKLQILLGALLLTSGIVAMEEGKADRLDSDELLAYLCSGEDEAKELPFDVQLKCRHRLLINLKEVSIAEDAKMGFNSRTSFNALVSRLVPVAGDSLVMHGRDHFIIYPLHLAVKNYFLSDINTLLLAGADYTAVDDEGRTILHIAFSLDKTEGRQKIIEKFFTDEVSLDKEDNKGNTLVSLALQAARKGDDQLMNYFLRQKNCKDTTNWFITKTLQSNNRLVVDKAKKCIVAEQDLDPIRLQCLNFVVQQLFKVCNKMLLPTQHYHYLPSPLHLAVKHALVACVYFLLDEGVDSNNQDYLGRAPLHIACSVEDLAARKTIIRKLLMAKATVDIADRGGNTSLTLAARQGDDRLVTLLLDNKANPNIHVFAAQQKETSKHACGDSPLYVAANRGHISTVKLLLEKNAQLKESEQHVIRLKLESTANEELKKLFLF